jgi:pimeloyl-ACP methyl ester carboxylesterase
MSDMRHQPSRDTMDPSACHGVWDAPNRDAAIEVARGSFGDDGGKMFEGGEMNLCAADLEFVMQAINDPAQAVSMQAQFANGVQAYVDDRLADGPGWVSFDVGAVRCPVTIVHGSEDTIVGPVNAHHTASLIPQSSLRIEPGHGHLSVIAQVVVPLLELVSTTS